MPLAVVLGALLAGSAFSFELGGRSFLVSWIDLAALGLVAVATVQLARRRRTPRWDVALGAYVAFLVVVLVQAVVLPQPLQILGGSSRFVTAALILASLTVLGPGERWREVVVWWGGVLGAWVVVELGVALADPALDTFYAVKNAIVVPLGASNTLGGYLLVPAVLGAVLATRDRRLLAPTLLAGAGVAASLSRGAIVAAVAALVLAAIAGRDRRLSLVAAGVSAVVGVAVLAITLAAAGAPDPGIPASGPGAPSVAAATPTPAAAASEGDLVEERLVGVTSSSPDGRVALWRAAGRAFLDAPLLGVGLNRITTVTAGLRQPHDHAHNLFLQALAESGLLGALAYLGIWAALARRLWRAEVSLERLGIGAGAVALFLHAQVEALTYQRGIEVVIAVLLACAGTLPGAAATREWRLPGTGAPQPHR